MNEDYSEALNNAKELMNQKADIEKKMANLELVLETQNIGMKEPLTDSDGFPRSDVDVYLVRTTRNQIIRLKNDYKELMEKIQKQLELVHSFHKKETSNQVVNR